MHFLRATNAQPKQSFQSRSRPKALTGLSFEQECEKGRRLRSDVPLLDWGQRAAICYCADSDAKNWFESGI